MAGAVPKQVPILFAPGVEPRVETGAATRHGHDPNVAGQMSIDGHSHPGGGHFDLAVRNFHLRGHAKGMHPGIRAAGTVQTRCAGENFGDRLLDPLLDSHSGLLRLPARVTGSVIGNDELEFHLPRLSR